MAFAFIRRFAPRPKTVFERNSLTLVDVSPHALFRSVSVIPSGKARRRFGLKYGDNMMAERPSPGIGGCFVAFARKSQRRKKFGNKPRPTPSTSVQADGNGATVRRKEPHRTNQKTRYRAMHMTGWQGARFLAIATCAAAAFGTAQAKSPMRTLGTNIGIEGGTHFDSGNTAPRTMAPGHAPQLASRDMAERYYQAYRLIGSYVLNLDGERIGQVDNLVLDDAGEIKQVLVALYDSRDTDGGSVAISPHRAEVVSTEGARVTVIRIDLTREELVHAQLARLKSNARAPAQRGAGSPDSHREYGTLY